MLPPAAPARRQARPCVAGPSASSRSSTARPRSSGWRRGPPRTAYSLRRPTFVRRTSRPPRGRSRMCRPLGDATAAAISRSRACGSRRTTSSTWAWLVRNVQLPAAGHARSVGRTSSAARTHRQGDAAVGGECAVVVERHDSRRGEREHARARARPTRTSGELLVAPPGGAAGQARPGASASAGGPRRAVRARRAARRRRSAASCRAARGRRPRRRPGRRPARETEHQVAGRRRPRGRAGAAGRAPGGRS